MGAIRPLFFYLYSFFEKCLPTWYNVGMRMFTIFGCLFLLLSGCGKISDIKTNAPEPEATGDPIYDSQSEFKLLVPWDWMVYDIKNVKKKPAYTGQF